MSMTTSSIRFAEGTLDKLRILAHVRSLETGIHVSWNELVRECVEKHLLGADIGASGVTLASPIPVAQEVAEESLSFGQL
jgi:hypothetical protein